MPVIELWDRKPLPTEHGETSQLAFDLQDVLAQLPPDKKALNWSILGLWAVAQDDDTDIGEIEARVAELAGSLSGASGALEATAQAYTQADQPLAGAP